MQILFMKNTSSKVNNWFLIQRSIKVVSLLFMNLQKEEKMKWIETEDGDWVNLENIDFITFSEGHIGLISIEFTYNVFNINDYEVPESPMKTAFFPYVKEVLGKFLKSDDSLFFQQDLDPNRIAHKK